MSAHRVTLARERAGLSLGQAAKLLGVTRSELLAIEEEPILSAVDAERFAELYAVNVEWVTGQAPLRDYDAMKGVRGYDNLTPHDRDVIAEFAASMPRKPQP
jgi:transcriptional regulator with XRE-family HTH domain